MVYFRLKDIVDENFQDYKKPSMLLVTCICNWKCLKEDNLDISICQNSTIVNQPTMKVSIDSIINRYLSNPITKAIIIAGLEPILQFDEVLEFVKQFRLRCEDDILIYTGYYPEEINEQISKLSIYKNIILKVGRYKHNAKKRFDDVLGIELISENQYAIKIS
jgi:hypothetical protein